MPCITVPMTIMVFLYPTLQPVRPNTSAEKKKQSYQSLLPSMQRKIKAPVLSRIASTHRRTTSLSTSGTLSSCTRLSLSPSVHFAANLLRDRRCRPESPHRPATLIVYKHNHPYTDTAITAHEWRTMDPAITAFVLCTRDPADFGGDTTAFGESGY